MNSMIQSLQRVRLLSQKSVICHLIACILVIVLIAVIPRSAISPKSVNYDPKHLRSPVPLPVIKQSHRNRLIIHQSWKTAQVPERMARWSLSWRKCFPNATHILWTDAENREFIRVHYPWFLYHYDTFPRNIQRADVVRYFYLFHYGGLYVDLDAECLRPFYHLLTPHRIVLGAMRGGSRSEGYVANSLMYSRPHETFWLDVIYRTLTAPSAYRPEDTTGPNTLMEAISWHRELLFGKSYIKVYPPRFFNPFSWYRNDVKYCKDFNQMSDRELIMCRKQFVKSSFVVQYHAQTWGRGEIK